MELSREKYIELQVKKHGEKYRSLIIDALKFLDEHEPKWGLKTPIHKGRYIAGLVKKAKKGEIKC